MNHLRGKSVLKIQKEEALVGKNKTGDQGSRKKTKKECRHKIQVKRAFQKGKTFRTEMLIGQIR